MKFNFSKVLNPVESLFSATDADGNNPITFRLSPLDTAVAFDGNRWKGLALSRQIADADELQFKIGASRIQGWRDVFDADGNEVEFTPQNFGAFTRLVEAIDYILAVGQHTLEELGIVSSVRSEVETKEGTLIEGKLEVTGRVLEEVSETSSETTPE